MHHLRGILPPGVTPWTTCWLLPSACMQQSQLRGRPVPCAWGLVAAQGAAMHAKGTGSATSGDGHWAASQLLTPLGLMLQSGCSRMQPCKLKGTSALHATAEGRETVAACQAGRREGCKRAACFHGMSSFIHQELSHVI